MLKTLRDPPSDAAVAERPIVDTVQIAPRIEPAYTSAHGSPCESACVIGLRIGPTNLILWHPGILEWGSSGTSDLQGKLEIQGKLAGSMLNVFFGGCTLSPMSVVFLRVFTRLRVLRRHPGIMVIFSLLLLVALVFAFPIFLGFHASSVRGEVSDFVVRR